MNDVLEFTAREDFRKWLQANCRTSDGVWLLFGKPGGPKTVKAEEALEEALCFGWIDGQMQRIDAVTYKKYFSERRENSKWSAKNKALTEQLEKQGIMTDYGREKITAAKKNGQWNAAQAEEITEEHILMVANLLKDSEPAHTNFLNISLSVKKTYARAYFDAKTDETRTKRLLWMTERLNNNLKPM